MEAQYRNAGLSLQEYQADLQRAQMAMQQADMKFNQQMAAANLANNQQQFSATLAANLQEQSQRNQLAQNQLNLQSSAAASEAQLRQRAYSDQIAQQQQAQQYNNMLNMAGSSAYQSGLSAINALGANATPMQKLFAMITGGAGALNQYGLGAQAYSTLYGGLNSLYSYELGSQGSTPQAPNMQQQTPGIGMVPSQSLVPLDNARAGIAYA